MTSTRKLVARSIRDCRRSRGISQAEVAERAGLQPSSVSHFETGSRLPSCMNLLQLADALGVSTDELLGRRDVARTIVIHGISDKDLRLVQALAHRLGRRGKP